MYIQRHMKSLAGFERQGGRQGAVAQGRGASNIFIRDRIGANRLKVSLATWKVERRKLFGMSRSRMS